MPGVYTSVTEIAAAELIGKEFRTGWPTVIVARGHRQDVSWYMPGADPPPLQPPTG